MKVTGFTRQSLAVRRQARRLRTAGWERIEGPWQLERGGRWRERIVEVEIGADGKSVWVRCEEPSPPVQTFGLWPLAK